MTRLAFLPLAFILPLSTSAGSGGANAMADAGCTLTIQCPSDAKLFCGGSIDPSALGTATAVSSCDPNPTITHHDTDTAPACPANRFDESIDRVWTATDSAGNTASCTQKIHVIKQSWFLDIHPTSCPNPINVNSHGNVPAAILGTATQDVTTIDPTTIQLWTENCTYGPVAPNLVTYEDNSAPYTGGQACGCTTAGPDGYIDLHLRFDTQTLVQTLHLASNPHGSYVKLVITARTVNGCGIVGTDCVRVQ